MVRVRLRFFERVEHVVGFFFRYAQLSCRLFSPSVKQAKLSHQICIIAFHFCLVFLKNHRLEKSKNHQIDYFHGLNLDFFLI